MATSTVALPAGRDEPRRSWMRLETGWGIALVLPYALFFLVFVVWPVLYGLWLGADVRNYERLFSDPIFNRTAFNTVVFLGVGINL
jgi:multiple sugar transport system permease protein